MEDQLVHLAIRAISFGICLVAGYILYRKWWYWLLLAFTAATTLLAALGIV